MALFFVDASDLVAREVTVIEAREQLFLGYLALSCASVGNFLCISLCNLCKSREATERKGERERESNVQCAECSAWLRVNTFVQAE